MADSEDSKGAYPFPGSPASTLLPPEPPTLAFRQSSVGAAAAQSFEICYLFSCPLVIRKADKKLEPVKAIDVLSEKERILRTCAESGKRFKIRFEMARTEIFNVVLTLGCRALHFSGHGLPNCLAFETPSGEVHPVEAESLQEIVENNFDPGKPPLDFAFVAACHSEMAGRAFVQAGVPHVVAVRWDSPVSDKTSQLFSRHFYLSLLLGHTIQRAFSGAKSMVRIDSESLREDEHNKFLLLPEDGDHNVSIFVGLPDGEFKDFSPTIAHNPLPRIPDHFKNRELVLHDVLKLLAKNRLISITGPKGIGKSSIVKYLSHYIYDRRFDYSGLFFFDMAELARRLSKDDPKCLGFLFSLELLPTNFISDTARTNREFFELIGPHRSSKLLFILDEVDIFLQFPKSSQWSLVSFLNELFKNCSNIKVITTSRDALDFIDDVGQFCLPIDKLSDNDIAQMIKDLCPRKLTSEELGKKKGESLADHPSIKALGGNPGLAKRALARLAKVKLNELEDIIPDLQRDLEEEKASTSALGWRALEELEDDLDVFQNLDISRTGAHFWISYLGKSLSNVATGEFKSALGLFFKKRTKSSRTLSDEELNFLVAAYFDKHHIKSGGDDSSFITLRGFGTFWSWFEALTDLIGRIDDFWVCPAGKVVYLNNKSECKRVFGGKPVGTFVIRFSESISGHLAASYLKAGVGVHHVLIDARSGDFRIKTDDGSIESRESLLELIRDWDELQYLVNGKDKYSAFGLEKPELVPKEASPDDDGPD